MDQIVEFELAEDVKEFINHNDDIDYADDSIKGIIQNSNNSDLLKVVKTISSPTTFISVNVVDDDFVNREL